MNNIVNIRPTRHVVTTVHRVTFDLVPRDIVEKLFYVAIAVGWAADEEAYSSSDPESADLLAALQTAVGAASQYTIPVEREIDEPI